MNFPQLETERLLLEQVMPADQSFVFEGLSHPDVIPFYGVRFSTFEETATQMEYYNDLIDKQTGIPWKIVTKENGTAIGVIAVYAYKPEHRKAEIGYWLLPQAWNKGYAKEAMLAVMDYWKQEKGLHRLEAFVEAGNDSSCQLLEKCGFTYEGTMKDCEIKEGRFISLLIYAILFN